MDRVGEDVILTTLGVGTILSIVQSIVLPDFLDVISWYGVSC